MKRKEKRREKNKTGEREEQKIYYTTEESRIFVNPVITRHYDASSSTFTADKNERKSENRKKECIVSKALRLES